MRATREYAIRAYEDADQPAVLELLGAALGPGPGGRRSPEFFGWKHQENPFGRSLMLVAEEEGRIIGLRALMRWRFRAGDGTVSAARPVDTATHPDAQGRGVFSRLTKEALSALKGSASLLFNTPNEKSLPGYLKMGWRVVGSIPISVKVRRPLRVAAGIRSLRRADAAPSEGRPRILAETAEAVLSDDAAISSLLEDPGMASSGRLMTLRTLEYLRWRFGAAPLLDYRAVRRDEDGAPAGMAIFRVRPRGRLWESTIAEILVRDGDPRLTAMLLRDVAQAAPVDVLTCHVSGSPARGPLRRRGFLRAPLGMTFVTHPLDDGVRPDPTELSSWALSLGDLEVF
ncbi:MAG TPA: GNAT family N-acetyltransferase [Actinomycetota bacterium]